MTPDIRKGVLLRLRPEVLARVDQVRGRQTRTAWLVGVILRELDALERPAAREPGLMSRTVSAFSEDEISSEEPASEHEYSTAEHATGGSGLDGEPFGDPADQSALEGPDVSAFEPGAEL